MLASQTVHQGSAIMDEPGARDLQLFEFTLLHGHDLIGTQVRCTPHHGQHSGVSLVRFGVRAVRLSEAPGLQRVHFHKR